MSDSAESAEYHAVGQTVEIELSEERATPSVGKDLAEQQQADSKLGPLMKLRLRSEQKPTITELSTESEVAKRMLNQWEQLEVREGLVYRRAEGKDRTLSPIPNGKEKMATKLKVNKCARLQQPKLWERSFT